MPVGFLIAQPDMSLFLAPGIVVSRRTIKHIVESRKKDGYDSTDLKQMFSRIPETFMFPDVSVPNTNQTHPGSSIVAKLYPEERQALLVVRLSHDSDVRVISAYYRSQKRFEKLKTETSSR